MEVRKCPSPLENRRENPKRGFEAGLPAVVAAAPLGMGRVWALLPELCPPWLGMARPSAPLLLSHVPISSHPLPLAPSRRPHQSLCNIHHQGSALMSPAKISRGPTTPKSSPPPPNHPHNPQIIPTTPRSSPVLQSSVPTALR